MRRIVYDDDDEVNSEATASSRTFRLRVPDCVSRRRAHDDIYSARTRTRKYSV